MTGPQPPLLEVADLVTHYQVRRGVTERPPRSPQQWVHAVDGVSFRLARGEMMALVGESGCGKTTTAQTILGMVKPPSGAAPRLGVGESGEGPMLVHGIGGSRAEREATAVDALERVGLSPARMYLNR